MCVCVCVCVCVWEGGVKIKDIDFLYKYKHPCALNNIDNRFKIAPLLEILIISFHYKKIIAVAGKISKRSAKQYADIF